MASFIAPDRERLAQFGRRAAGAARRPRAARRRARATSAIAALAPRRRTPADGLPRQLRRARAARRHLRLHAVLAAAGRRLRPAPRARPARGAGRRHRAAASRRSPSSSRGLYRPWQGEILLRRRSRATTLPRAVARPLGRDGRSGHLRCSRARCATTSRSGTTPSPKPTSCRPPRTPASTTTSRSSPGGYDARVERGRPQLQRRPAPAARDRARAGAAARAAGARRGDQRARPRDRAADRREPAPARLHLPDRRPPPEHDPRLRRDHRARARPRRAARHARAAAGAAAASTAS